MRDTLELTFYGSDIILCYSKELDNRKGTINPDERMLKEEADEIAKQIKHLKGFNRFVVGFSPIDYYDSCGSYEVPCARCDSGNLKTRILYDEFNEIPKDWEKYYTLRVEKMENVRILNKFTSALGITLDSKQLNKFRKAIKEKQNIEIEIN